MTAVITREALAFTVDPGPFKAAVSAVVRRVQARPTNPVLGCVLLRLSGGDLSLSAYDEEVAVTSTIAADGHTDGSALVSGRLLGTLVETLPAKPVEGELRGDRFVLRCGRVELDLPTLPDSDFPHLPELPARIGTVDADAFSGTVRGVAVATEPNATPIVLTAMWLSFGERIEFGATDKYRMALDSMAWDHDGNDTHTALVPAQILAELVPMFAGAGEIGVHVDNSTFGLSSRAVTVVARQYAAHTNEKATEHPGARMATVIPAADDSPVQVDAAELMSDLSRANKVHETDQPIILNLAADEISVRATGADTTKAAAEGLPCTYTGPPMEVRVRPDYLISAVKACGTAEIQLSFPGGAKKAFLVLPKVDDPDDGTAKVVDPYRHLVMPIQPPKAQQ